VFAAWVLSGCGLFLDISAGELDGGGNRLDAARIDAAQIDAAAVDAQGPDAGAGDAGEPGVCGDGVLGRGESCDDGNNASGDGCESDCTFSCTSDEGCDDGENCTVDLCDLASHRCVSRVAPCPAPDLCSVMVGCDSEGTCLFETFDEDGDGHAPTALGACGDDCDDGNGDIHPGAVEVCNAVDDNCNERIDEGVGRACGEDADGDGFGSSSSGTTVCGLADCPDGFVADVSDCWDDAGSFFPPPAVAQPGQMNWFSEPRGDGTGSFDWDCSGVEEQQATAVFASCSPSGGGCETQSGWGAAGVARCGDRAEYFYCQSEVMGGCVVVRGMRTQNCH